MFHIRSFRLILFVNGYAMSGFNSGSSGFPKSKNQHIYIKNHYIYIYISDDQEKETFDSLLPRKETTR